MGQQQDGHKSYEQPPHKLDTSMDAMMSMDIDNNVNTQTHINIDDVCMQVTSAMQWLAEWISWLVVSI